MSGATFGVIVGNRGFFPDVLARDGRHEVLAVLAAQGYNAICLTPDDTKFGSVETLSDARKCAELFKQHRDQIDGVLVSDDLQTFLQGCCRVVPQHDHITALTAVFKKGMCISGAQSGTGAGARMLSRQMARLCAFKTTWSWAR